MAIDTSGYITVEQAAKRLNLSLEQVRRKLRAGKLKGYRLGNQWFVDANAVTKQDKPRPLIPPDSTERIHRLRDEIAEYSQRQGNPPIDVLKLIREHRDET